MQNLVSGLALGFALGLLLSSAASALDGEGMPWVELSLAAVLLGGIAAEVLRVRRAEAQERAKAPLDA